MSTICEHMPTPGVWHELYETIFLNFEKDNDCLTTSHQIFHTNKKMQTYIHNL